jgi:hypothetical protein
LMSSLRERVVVFVIGPTSSLSVLIGPRAEHQWWSSSD